MFMIVFIVKIPVRVAGRKFRRAFGNIGKCCIRVTAPVSHLNRKRPITAPERTTWEKPPVAAHLIRARRRTGCDLSHVTVGRIHPPRRRGMHIGVFVTGSGMTFECTSKTCRMVSAVMTSAGGADATILPSFSITM